MDMKVDEKKQHAVFSPYVINICGDNFQKILANIEDLYKSLSSEIVCGWP
jgi:hypothetical protein